MSIYLCAKESGGRERNERLVPLPPDQARLIAEADHAWTACIDDIPFLLTRESAARHGASGHDVWTLKLRRTELRSGTFWKWDELRLAELPLHPNLETALANGWQCWSESPILGAAEVLRREAFPERACFGDDPLFPYPERPGQPHAWSFSYGQVAARNGGRGVGLFAALDEDLFFTRFEFDLPSRRLAIALDTEGAAFENIRTPRDRGSPYLTLGAWLVPSPACAAFGSLSRLAQAWMRLVREHERVPRSVSEEERGPLRVPVRGYTSWYLHYNAIDERTLGANLAAFAQRVLPNDPMARIFQIDDGWQEGIGDWLATSAGFPRGMAPLAAAAREAGFEPGLWCAPFIATEHSRLAREHPDWLLRDDAGTLVLCGDHPLWGGRFYALDSEHPDVRAYLEQTLSIILGRWGFQFLKADFLYAAARIPAGGFTRAQRSARAHEFLSASCHAHGARFLSCGAPLASTYMRCDYARIGADVGETWENDEFGARPSREKVSTRGTLVNTITRSFLAGRAFGVDPDVVILREERQRMARTERLLLAEVNRALGTLVFTSDDVSTWEPWQLEAFTSTRADAPPPIASVRSENGLLVVEFEDGSRMVVNLDDAPRCLDDHFDDAPRSLDDRFDDRLVLAPRSCVRLPARADLSRQQSMQDASAPTSSPSSRAHAPTHAPTPQGATP
jgi:alpha-galactosidase